MKANYHTHAWYCDGKEPPRAYIEKAIELGFQGLGFSSHSPLPFDTVWNMKQEQIPGYLKDLNALRDEFRNKLDVYIGIEMDFIPGQQSVRDLPAKKSEFDYVIGSVHFIPAGERLEEVDGSQKEFDALLTKHYQGDIRLLAKTYFSHMQEMLSEGGMDIIGHFDLLMKNNPGNTYFDSNEDWYQKLAFEALDCAVGTNEILEINTGGMSRGRTKDAYPNLEFLKFAKSKNIPIVFSADAHSSDGLEFAFDRAESLAREAGYSSRMVLTNSGWQETDIAW
jgi:histidinol-phosphatase (PHP family)